MAALIYRMQLISALLPPRDKENAMLQGVCDFLSECYITSEQLCALLDLFHAPQARIEVFVKAFARVVDWMNLSHVVSRFAQPEINVLGRRIGFVNLFNEVMAANYYELDLADAEHRWVAQELVHLGAVEPGKNCIEVQLNGIDFDIPAGWEREVPRRGLLELYYCRTKDVTLRVLEHGAWDHKDSPWAPQGRSLSMFMQSYLLDFCRDSDAGSDRRRLISAVPFGDKWCRPNKLRRIRTKLAATFSSAHECFCKLDDDGGGSINRKELVLGLFKLGVWLHPSESQALMDVLDGDGGGEIEEDEMEDYWSAYVFDGFQSGAIQTNSGF